jgi:hypothetical protein
MDVPGVATSKCNHCREDVNAGDYCYGKSLHSAEVDHAGALAGGEVNPRTRAAALATD